MQCNLALDAGIRPRLHLEDASRAAIDFIRYFVQAVLEKAAPYPDSLRPKIPDLRYTWFKPFPTKTFLSPEAYRSCSKLFGPTALGRLTLSFTLIMTQA